MTNFLWSRMNKERKWKDFIKDIKKLLIINKLILYFFNI